MKEKRNKDKKDNGDSGSTNIFKFFENFRKLLWKAKIYNLSLKNLLKVDKRELSKVETYSKLEELITILKIFKKNKLYTNSNVDKLKQFVGKNSNVNSIKILNKLPIVGNNIKRTTNNTFSFNNIKKKYIKPFVEAIKKKTNKLIQILNTMKSAIKLIISNIIYANIDGIIDIINRDTKTVAFKEINNNNNCKNTKFTNEIDKNTETKIVQWEQYVMIETTKMITKIAIYNHLIILIVITLR